MGTAFTSYICLYILPSSSRVVDGSTFTNICYLSPSSSSSRVVDGNPLAVHVLRKQFQNTDNVHVVAPAVTIGSGTGRGES
jgi:hypothetical protein